MHHKLVSIIIPLYNAEKYIKETLDSVLSQSYSNWECIIVDDGSTDSSKKIALEYCAKDARFKYFHQPNSGPSAARNHGLKISSGDYIQYLDADDVIFPERLKLMVTQSDKLEKNVILYSSLLLGNCDSIYKTEDYRF
ncbi:MAG: glycosyltransferase, partial [Bacteroidales bacterium]|nr:glycosyltransferase [Bacteroidales bacterium]